MRQPISVVLNWRGVERALWEVWTPMIPSEAQGWLRSTELSLPALFQGASGSLTFPLIPHGP